MPAPSKRDGARASHDIAAASQGLDYGSGGCRMQEAAKTGMIVRGIFSTAIELVGSSDLGPALLRFGLSLPRARGDLCAPVLAPADATRAPSQ